jgi:hypothetical protein
VTAHLQRVKYWEIIADNLSKAGFSWGYVSAVDSNGRMRRSTTATQCCSASSAE